MVRQSSGKSQSQVEYLPVKYAQKNYEFGFSVGTPSLVNLTVGYWEPGDYPFVFRVMGMYWLNKVRGFETHAGWLFDSTGYVRQYLGVGYSWSDLAILVHKDNSLKTTGIGPFYGVDWAGLSFSLGVVFGPSDTFKVGNATNGYISSPFPRFSIGYSFFQ